LVNTTMIWTKTVGRNSWPKLSGDLERHLKSVMKEHWMIYYEVDMLGRPLDSDHDSEKETHTMPSCCEERWPLLFTPLGYSEFPDDSIYAMSDDHAELSDEDDSN
jgi:hypothetical protein